MQQFQPMQPPGYPYQPGFPPPRRGSGVKAFLLGWLISGFGATLFAGLLVASYDDLSKVGLRVMYVVFALVLALVVGSVAGKMGGPNPGAYVAPALLAMLAVFMGTANGYVFVLLDAGGTDVLDAMLEHEPGAPAEFWWKGLKGGIALLGLAVAGGGVFAMANLVGKRQR
ncbi:MULTISPECIES: hypothetical protein [unclassified Streptomyces]|uniref:hypothetical protein n=1 Tax=unclassified Streptomyces TaxID=2593676 RepID=UPI002DDBD0BD|nr:MULTISPECIES: hypothetical protein [unclassified Streptomyces]WSA96069.1 hypothetical protein OIE63_34310 [Streptomyces sp. NBC_01795]WSB80484.1 hypothetical protein OHB04_35415 [Streptomyces sp. NBC_01775]WSS11309.1 hypothetical protein OG533_04840 [Streptomyces sp. NBC_01186]WSS40019.1 hypothetical protein OG220_04945 [Streptomyces sp. NBC_01187]